jgi:structure-specific endonuclease subunit SLX1
MSFVYLLVATNGNTYVGATIDLERRLRQHNKEIKGGAHATGIKVSQGETWTRAAHVSGFPDWQAALQFEWRWKQLTRSTLKSTFKKVEQKTTAQFGKMNPLKRRMVALKQLLALERPTSKATAYSEWECKPQVHCENTESQQMFDEIDDICAK